MVDGSNPTVWLRQVGVELRRYRLAARKTTHQAGAHIGSTHSKISKIENAHLGVKSGELRRLLEFYGAPAEVVEALVQINEQPHEREWWMPYRDAMPDWFRRYASMEAAAAEIRTFETENIPGLLQTEDYARAMLRTWEPDAGDQVLRGPLELRMLRQRVLTREDPLQLIVVVSESSLRKVIGDAGVMRGQLRRLMDAGANVELHVLPFDAPSHPAITTPFSLLIFPDQDDAIVYLEDVVGATYVDKPPDHVGRYNVVFNRLRRAALDPNESRKFIATIERTYA